MRSITIAVLAILCAACASTADRTAEPYEGKEYRTGSNLPVRDRTGAQDDKTVDRSTIEDLQRRTGTTSLAK